MDLVISNVSTVEKEEEEEDEPLLEISKITVLNEQEFANERQEVRNEPKNHSPKYIKLCFVPLCPNTSKSTPEKMFITVPVNPARRKKWFDAVGKSTIGKNPKSPMFCCEDHFNLKNDMKNYEEHLRKGKVQMLLHQTACPHIFVCNKYGHLKRSERIEILRRIHAKKEHLKAASIFHPTQEPQQQIRLNQRQRTFKALKAARKVLDLDEITITPRKTVFIEMPVYEFSDQPEYIQVEENGVDTIVIDDSD